MKTLLMIFLAAGGVLIGVSIPLIQRRVPPNPWYGFRVRRTLEAPHVWYPVNVYAGWRMLWLGTAITLAAGVLYVVPGLNEAWYASLVGIVAAAAVMTFLMQCFRYLRKLTDENKKVK
jgi:hypothetical protein